MHIMMECLPCPCCGSSNLHIGVTSSSSVGIQCLSCSLVMRSEIPSEYPDDFSDNLVGQDAANHLIVLTIEDIVCKWNRRTIKIGKTAEIVCEMPHFS